MIDTSQTAALADPTFRDHVAKADAARDSRHWQGAADAYGEALRLFPFEPTYWTQLAHVVKEQSNFPLAEIFYRTALAYGTEPFDVLPHLRFVMARQGVTETQFPIGIHCKAAAALQVPGSPDVMAFARLMWGALWVDEPDRLMLLRTCLTCDELVAAMARDPRFERANRVWLELVQEDEL
ncbi:MAG: hypothetical protein ACXIUO_03075 [Erythrobacter sp.]